MREAERDEVDEARAQVDALVNEPEEAAEPTGGLDLPMTEYAVVSRLVASDRQKVRWMYREEPTEPADSGWRFFSGDEAEDFADDQDNFEFHPLDFVTEIDPSVAPYLERDAPCAFERESPEGGFTEVTDFALPGEAAEE